MVLNSGLIIALHSKNLFNTPFKGGVKNIYLLTYFKINYILAFFMKTMFSRTKIIKSSIVLVL